MPNINTEIVNENYDNDSFWRINKRRFILRTTERLNSIIVRGWKRKKAITVTTRVISVEARFFIILASLLLVHTEPSKHWRKLFEKWCEHYPMIDIGVNEFWSGLHKIFIYCQREKRNEPSPKYLIQFWLKSKSFTRKTSFPGKHLANEIALPWKKTEWMSSIKNGISFTIYVKFMNYSKSWIQVSKQAYCQDTG